VTRLALMALGAAAALAAGCGDDQASGSGSGQRAPAEKPTQASRNGQDAAPARRGATVKVVDSQFGRILADRRGQALYLFAREKGKTSKCYGACATAWPPLLTKGRPRARGAARGRLLGTTRRRGGKLQVTYRGHPLYYYKDDAPGRVLCQNVNEFGGLWLVVRPSGRPVS
jgi:predicted lipoprotein with Yx(FWY)xxD motif